MKGPWFVKQAQDGVHVIDEEGTRIMTCSPLRQAYDNACLAAAAPEMLRIMKEMLTYAVIPKAVKPHWELWEKAENLVKRLQETK